MMTSNGLIVLDRDGVINEDHGYVHTIDRFDFLEGIFEFCKIAEARGCLIAVATNQAGIARGLYSEDDFETLNKWMLERFHEQGINIAHVFHCSHHPDFPTTGQGTCLCRKPLPGMLLEASLQTGIPKSKAVMVGNSESDISAGRAAEFSHCVKIGEGSINSDFNFASVNELSVWAKSDWFWAI
jgi:D-glycero-D-manno-heptose 1,7-bisphosphate phosphatase